MSKKISDACYPVTVKMGKKFENGNLVLNVMHGKELDVEYEKNEIIDKINSFFGYNCISKVTLKIVQNKIIEKNKIFTKIKDLDKIEKNLEKVNNEQLKSSLNALLKAYNGKN